jgi:hypothetical protein
MRRPENRFDAEIASVSYQGDTMQAGFSCKWLILMVGTGRFELPTPRTPSECSTRLSHVPTAKLTS